jgi:O-antigen ligase
MDPKETLEKSVASSGILVTLAVFPAMMDPINVPKLIILALVFFTFLAITLKLLESFYVSRTFILLITIWLGSLISGVLNSDQSLYKSLVGTWGRNNGFFSYTLLTGVMVVTSLVAAKKKLDLLGTRFAKFGFFIALYGLVQYFKFDFIPWSAGDLPIILTLGNSNFSGVFLSFVGVATLGLILKSGIKSTSTYFFLVFLFLQLFLLYKTQAQMSVITFVVGAATLIGFRLTFSDSIIRRRFGILWWTGFVIVAFLTFVSLLTQAAQLRFLARGRSSLIDRYYHWLTAIDMMKANPLTGVGMDAFGDNYRLFRLPEAIALRGTATTGTNNAHNVYLQLGATGGLPLLISFSLLILFVTYRGYVLLKSSKGASPVNFLYSIWLMFVLQMFVSIDQIGLTIWGWIIGGYLVGSSFYVPDVNLNSIKVKKNLKSEHRQNLILFKPSAFVRNSTLTLSFLACCSVLPLGWDEINLRKSLMGVSNQVNTGVAKPDTSYLVEATEGVFQPELKLLGVSYLLKFGDVESAKRIAIVVTNEFPKSVEAWDAVATIYEETGFRAKAVKYREKTVTLDPLNDVFADKLIEDRQGEG